MEVELPSSDNENALEVEHHDSSFRYCSKQKEEEN